MNRNAILLPTVVIMSVAILIVAGCRARPAEKQVFLKDAHLMKKYDYLPFDKAWKEKGVDLKKYDKIIVEPVFTKDQLKKTKLEKLNIRTWLGQEKADVKEFANYTRQAFEKAIKNDKRLQLATKPGPNTMILQLALVKIVPGKPLLGIVRNVPAPTKAAFFITPAKTAAGGGTDSPLKASVAIEGRLLDSQTRQVIARFADREKQTSALVNLRDFTAYGNLEEIVDQWAKEVVETLNRKKGEKVENLNKPIKLINL